MVTNPVELGEKLPVGSVTVNVPPPLVHPPVLQVWAQLPVAEIILPIKSVLESMVYSILKGEFAAPSPSIC